MKTKFPKQPRRNGNHEARPRGRRQLHLAARLTDVSRRGKSSSSARDIKTTGFRVKRGSIGPFHSFHPLETPPEAEIKQSYLAPVSSDITPTITKSQKFTNAPSKSMATNTTIVESVSSRNFLKPVSLGSHGHVVLCNSTLTSEKNLRNFVSIA